MVDTIGIPTFCRCKLVPNQKKKKKKAISKKRKKSHLIKFLTTLQSIIFMILRSEKKYGDYIKSGKENNLLWGFSWINKFIFH